MLKGLRCLWTEQSIGKEMWKVIVHRFDQSSTALCVRALKGTVCVCCCCCVALRIDLCFEIVSFVIRSPNFKLCHPNELGFLSVAIVPMAWVVSASLSMQCPVACDQPRGPGDVRIHTHTHTHGERQRIDKNKEGQDHRSPLGKSCPLLLLLLLFLLFPFAAQALWKVVESLCVHSHFGQGIEWNYLCQPNRPTVFHGSWFDYARWHDFESLSISLSTRTDRQLFSVDICARID